MCARTCIYMLCASLLAADSSSSIKVCTRSRRRAFFLAYLVTLPKFVYLLLSKLSSCSNSIFSYQSVVLFAHKLCIITSLDNPVAIVPLDFICTVGCSRCSFTSMSKFMSWIIAGWIQIWIWSGGRRLIPFIVFSCKKALNTTVCCRKCSRLEDAKITRPWILANLLLEWHRKF